MEYLFTSERLGFRNWKMEDLDDLAQLCADPEVMEHFPSTLSRAETEAYLRRMKRHFDEHGYNYFATEGALRCLTFAFEELGLTRVVSTCVLANSRSEKVMKKIGMTRMGEFKHPKLVHHPDFEKSVWYQISR